MPVCIEHHGLLILSRNPGRKLGIETHPVVELLEVDDGAVLALLERLVGARAVVVRHPPRAATLLRVALRRAIPAACHANPRTLVSHPTRPDGGGPRPAPGRRPGGAEGWREGDEARAGSTCAVGALGRGGEGGGRVVAGALVHAAAARRKLLRRLELGRVGFGSDSIRCGVSESACARIGWRERERNRGGRVVGPGPELWPGGLAVWVGR